MLAQRYAVAAVGLLYGDGDPLRDGHHVRQQVIGDDLQVLVVRTGHDQDIAGIARHCLTAHESAERTRVAGRGVTGRLVSTA